MNFHEYYTRTKRRKMKLVFWMVFLLTVEILLISSKRLDLILSSFLGLDLIIFCLWSERQEYQNQKDLSQVKFGENNKS